MKEEEVLATKLDGVWVQAILDFDGAKDLLAHNKHFEEFAAIVEGKLKRFVKQKPDDAPPESPLDSPA